MIARVSLAICVAFAVAGCGKGNQAPPVGAGVTNFAPVEVDHSPKAVVQTAVTATPAPPAETNAAPDLRDMSREVRSWILARKRVPKNFEEFAATAGIKIPPPPAGKKYVLDANLHVQLADR